MVDMQNQTSTRQIVVIGAGPAAWRFVRAFQEKDGGTSHITVLNEEPYLPYDRVALEKIFQDPDKDLTLGEAALWDAPNITLLNQVTGTKIDRASQAVHASNGRVYPYDELVLATGSSAVKIPIPGSEAAHVFRTIDGVKKVVSEMARLKQELGRAPKAIVVGGGR